MAYEVNFDGLVGPTHHYGGLAFGNLASSINAQSVSHPKEAALQGLQKMKMLADRGFKQAVLPPQPRPAMAFLRRLGFLGSDEAILAEVAKVQPQLLSAAYSASSMWTANAATVSPSSDTADGRVHFTPANLVTHLHRAIEVEATVSALKSIFADERYFCHHEPLPNLSQFSDEGAANHMRFCKTYGDGGIELFVYGKQAFSKGLQPKKFLARQTLEASQALMRLHGLSAKKTLFAQQNPELIDAGAFHNDVVAVSNTNVLLHYEGAFVDELRVLCELQQAMTDAPLTVITVPRAAVPVADAISSYLFNSQLLSKDNGKMLLVCPVEVAETASTAAYVKHLLEDSSNPIDETITVDCRQSMRNGGGPACLRIRVVLTEAEYQAMHPGVILTDTLYQDLVAIIHRYYRDELAPADLLDPHLLRESKAALDAITSLLQLTQPT